MESYCGFSVHGVDALLREAGAIPPGEARRTMIADAAFEEARLTSAAGGNCVRVFYTYRGLCGSLSEQPLGLDLLPTTHHGPWHLLQRQEKLGIVSDLSVWIWRLAGILNDLNDRGDGLDFADLDAYVGGYRRFNEQQADPDSRVRLLLTNVIQPPRQIIESPSDVQLAHHGLPFRFADIWGLYCQIAANFARFLVNRYVAVAPQDPLVIAFELCNEPDYEWLPDELRIEKGLDKDASRLCKYITELHGPQIPQGEPAPHYAERTPWGAFQEQDGNWPSTQQYPVGVLQYDWGSKFDFYLRCYGDFAKHVSYAFHAAADKLGASLNILSGGVTHNNFDYLIRLHRLVPGAFDFCTAIALHPYHWPEYDIHDTQFIRRRDYRHWTGASPRLFAQQYFKCFDFFRVFSDLSRPGSSYPGFRGKKLWLTEFGLGTKLMGHYNEDAWEHVPFIRPRRMPADALPKHSAVWEDIWDAFLTLVTPDALHALGVEAMFFYSLREESFAGLDKHDDDRTNFALLGRDGFPRMDPATFQRLTGFIRGMTGRDPDAGAVAFSLVPPRARAQDFSHELLLSQPWKFIAAPDSVFDTLSMLSRDEKRFLYWVTKRYFSARGAIVDAGCFAGGSTVALGTGLGETWPEPEYIVNSYDIFLVDDYMAQHYFPTRTLQGNRFRNVFDEETLKVREKIRVSDGDITSFGWSGGPVEILFLDVCKTWEVNDYCMRTFFTKLIPGQSLVIQQDYFHHAEEWLVASMELLWDKFDYIAQVPLNTAVFRLRSPITEADLPPSLRELGLDRLEALILRNAERFDDPFQKAMVHSALAKLYADFGDPVRARAAAAHAADISGNDHWVMVGLQDIAL